ncbi:sensor histidine kinase [Streptosporangium sandarakinum]|uniref:histidine kinase n=1 Tax=Streptosporangium sandarakinum TaxID=1260955 RepID=A0A852V1P2_9ACTN|nr:sensor histidine kinase [Streptosporangium sandarakinum]NYF43682.1 signal transduction histidine kinase [Streptosporangium sandarakinum]
MRSVEGWRPLAQDGLLAAVMAALLSVVVLGTPGTGAADLAAALAGSLALVAWRRAPLVALLVGTACMLVVTARVQPGPPASFPVLVSVFATVRAGHRLAPALASVVFLGVNLAANLPGSDGPVQVLQDASLLVGWFVAAGVAATVTRHRQAYLEEAERRAAEAERTREEAALRRAGEERLRIARELHDSLTHSISIIKVQAGVAVHLARKRSEDVPPALLAIQEAGGDAMRELRATLEVLRDPGHSGDPDHPGGSGGSEGSGGSGGEVAASGLDRLGGLVERARSAGLPVTVTISGTRRELPPEVDRAAYRIVQEALTNVSRHAGGAAAAVRVGYADEELVVQIDDDGGADPAAPPVPGTGLLGMRERVAALGGRLRAAPRPGGGFTVRAELPLGEPVRAGLPLGGAS